jgi:hypothetical protein
VELLVGAAPEEVFDVVSDVTRIGERSPECRSAAWEAGTPGTVGAVFRGRNRSGRAARWSRRCEVTAAERGKVFAFRTLPERWDPSRLDSSTWTYELEPADGGTLVRHSYEIHRLPWGPFRAVAGVLLPQHRDMRPQMAHNLAVLREQLTGTGRAG